MVVGVQPVVGGAPGGESIGENPHLQRVLVVGIQPRRRADDGQVGARDRRVVGEDDVGVRQVVGQATVDDSAGIVNGEGRVVRVEQAEDVVIRARRRRARVGRADDGVEEQHLPVERRRVGVCVRVDDVARVVGQAAGREDGFADLRPRRTGEQQGPGESP